ncbi:hypothetical protein [Nocardia araoensis]|uniref:hypothetical protein n=1 Tax=Nocardia araoensis TaxID=228600 RepID=UPI0005846CAF|nr:hypothetical protein [Nocardia araoensis]
MSTPSAPTSPWGRVLLVTCLTATLLIGMLSAFALPAINSKPHELPLAVSGPGALQTEQQLERAYPGAFDITVVSDAGAARARILDRDVYGAINTSASGSPELMVASAAGPAVGALLKEAATRFGNDVQVTDVRPLPADDPKGAGLSAGALPLSLGGYIGAILLLFLVQGTAQRVVGSIGFALVGGFSLTALLQYGLGAVDGNYWITAAGAALGIAASCWMILGMRTAFGNVGLALGALTLIFLGNPLSGLTSAPEMLPAGWGAFGQLLPPGATGSLLRCLAYFDGAGATKPLLVLAVWVVCGVFFFAIGTLRETRQRAAAASDAPRQAELASV